MGPPVLGGRVQLFGREPERAAIDRLIEGARLSHGGALVLQAEPGGGKSALLAYALGCSDGMRVLRTSGLEPEIDLPFAGLHQLLRPAFPYLDRLPEVQASTLRSALGIGPGSAENRFVTALAVLSLLAEVATEDPVLCLIDDAHWLDRPSADAVTFAARRLEGERIAMLFATRSGDASSFVGTDLPGQEVPGLDPPDAEALLLDRFGTAISPDVRRMICESAAGNPLALLEIPEALSAEELTGGAPVPRPMPMGHDLENVLLGGVRQLPAPARLLLLLAAAEGSGDVDVVLAAGARLGLSAAALLESETAGLVRTENGGLAFCHPGLRSAIYRTASLTQRKLVHHALAEVLDGEADADRRAWQRAAPLLGPDDGIADELERTAWRARNRSGHAAASAALRRAAELTSSAPGRARRLATAAREAWEAGDPAEASALVRGIDGRAPDAVVAELRHVQGEIALFCGSPLQGAGLLIEGAEGIASTDPLKALQMLFDAAMCANYAGDYRTMADAGRLASELPIDDSDPRAALADLLGGVVQLMAAPDPGARARLARSLDRISDVRDPRWLIWAGAAAALLGDQDRNDTLCRRAEQVARDSMAMATLPRVLERLAWTQMIYGRITAAQVHAEEGLRLALEIGLPNSACFHRAVLAWVAAVHGEQDTTLSLAAQVSKTALDHGLSPHGAIAGWAVGLLHLGLGDWERAATRLEGLLSPASEIGNPFVARRALPDLVEAAVRADRRNLATTAATRVQHLVREGAAAWELALAARCRALLARSAGVREEWYTEALALDARDRRPLNRARTSLLLGEHLRRERRRAEARPYLRDSLDTFERVGAGPWEKRARAELRATGETARKREPASVTQLTPQQVQIAGLVAEGATNKEVAAQLFLSPRTVDYHLRRVFTKLEISSRAELIRLQWADR